jgi:hypothetical protein
MRILCLVGKGRIEGNAIDYCCPKHRMTRPNTSVDHADDGGIIRGARALSGQGSHVLQIGQLIGCETRLGNGIDQTDLV